MEASHRPRSGTVSRARRTTVGGALPAQVEQQDPKRRDALRRDLGARYQSTVDGLLPPRSEVTMIAPSNTCFDALMLMDSRRTDCLVLARDVEYGGGEGEFTVLRRRHLLGLIASARMPFDVPVSSIVTAEMAMRSVSATASLAECAQLMERHGVAELLVVPPKHGMKKKVVASKASAGYGGDGAEDDEHVPTMVRHEGAANVSGIVTDLMLTKRVFGAIFESSSIGFLQGKGEDDGPASAPSGLAKSLASLPVQVAMLLLLLLECVIVTVEQFYSSRVDAESAEVLHLASAAILLLFSVELLLSVSAVGVRRFCSDRYALFDFFVVLTASAVWCVGMFYEEVRLRPHNAGVTLAELTIFLRAMRFLRVLRVLWRLHKTRRSLLSASRSLVSQNKRRLTIDGADLDLTYVSERIIAMSYPSTGFEALYRNSASSVSQFLDLRHPGAYKVYNLCVEAGRDYPPETFHGRVERIGCMDHNTPEYKQILQFVASCRTFLEEPGSVVAAHCKGGKGRTGTMICALLLATGVVATAEAALDLFAQKRTEEGAEPGTQGVSGPSQRRFVFYYAKGLRMACKPRPLRRQIRRIVLRTLPSGVQPAYLVLNGVSLKELHGKEVSRQCEFHQQLAAASNAAPLGKESQKRFASLTHRTSEEQARSLAKQHHDSEQHEQHIDRAASVSFKVDRDVCDHVKIELRGSSVVGKGDLLLFVTLSARSGFMESEMAFTQSLSKAELDVAAKDTRCERWAEELGLDVLWGPVLGEAKDEGALQDEAEGAGDEQAVSPSSAELAQITSPSQHQTAPVPQSRAKKGRRLFSSGSPKDAAVDRAADDLGAGFEAHMRASMSGRAALPVLAPYAMDHFLVEEDETGFDRFAAGDAAI